MSGQNTNEPNQDGNEPGEQTPDAGGEFQPITSQEELNKLIGKTRDEERRKAAGKFSDYGDLKAKAARLDEIEQANKSEIERAAEAKAKAEAERDAARAEALRLRIATKHGISDEDADLYLTGKDEETLTRQAERLAELAGDRKKQGNHAPREGLTPPSSGSSDDATFARNLLAGGD